MVVDHLTDQNFISSYDILRHYIETLRYDVSNFATNA